MNIPVCLNDATYSCGCLISSFGDLEKANRESTAEATLDAGQLFLLGGLVHLYDFMIPCWTTANSFTALEKKKLLETLPDTEYALHKRFGACRGPVRFHVDLA
ncbi:MAG: hypothetical protein V1766_06730 [Pseudomonadota bacterium]